MAFSHRFVYGMALTTETKDRSRYFVSHAVFGGGKEMGNLYLFLNLTFSRTELESVPCDWDLWKLSAPLSNGNCTCAFI